MDSHPTTNHTILPKKINWLHVSPFILYILLSPIYIIGSGKPQIADLFMGIGIIGLCVTSLTQFNTKMRFIFLIGILFSVYTICINLINYHYYPHARFLMSGVYYLYNILIFIYVVKLFETYGSNIKNLASSLLTYVIIAEFLWAVFVPQDHWREIGTFNNPNQLSYWCLLTAVMVVILREGKQLSWKEISLIGVLGILETLALSKASLISFSVFLMILAFSGLISNVKKLVIMTAVIIALSASVAAVGGPSIVLSLFKAPIERIQNIGQEPDDSIEARGYTRPLKFPAYAILGAGEGAFDRFEKEQGLELHSAIVTILFSYGIVGFGLFAVFLLQVIKKKPIYLILMLAPVFMVGLTGQTFRFSHFWLLMALTYVSYRPPFVVHHKEKQQTPYFGFSKTMT